jgi:hypothetical protein
MKGLKDIGSKNPFRVPDNYFENFNRRIVDITSGSEEIRTERGIIRKLRPYLALAASVALIVALGYTALYFSGNRNSNLEFPEMTLSELPDSYLNDIDILTLEENVATIGLFQEGSGVNNEDIINYLVLENIDVYDIYEQL